MGANVTLGRSMVFRSDYKDSNGLLEGWADENVPSRLSNRTLLAGNVLFIGKDS